MKRCIRIKRIRAHIKGMPPAMRGDSHSMSNTVRCVECAYLMFSDCYGECSKGYKGIVSPDDSCGKGVLREDYKDGKVRK